MAADEPLSIDKLVAIFATDVALSKKEIQVLLEELQRDYQNSGIELKSLASGFAFQTKAEYASWVARLWQEKPPKYSRALLETLIIIAYRQPVTRPEIEEIRGVAVNSSIIKTLLEREWIRTVGYKEVPGKPVLFATTPYFLDYFNLKTLADLPEQVLSLNFEQTTISTTIGEPDEIDQETVLL